MKADEHLHKAADFFKKRNSEYGDAYLRHGKIMKLLFPDGVTLNSKEDFYSYHIIVMAVVKMTRICEAFGRNKHHMDSWLDLMVYSAMYMEGADNGENNNNRRQ